MRVNYAVALSFLKGLLKRLVSRAVKLTVTPTEFFQTMPKDDGLIDPLLYVVIAALLDVVLVAIGSFVTHGAGIHDFGMLVTGLIVMPIIAVILSFFVAGLFYIAWAFMGSSESYGISYRCLAYMQIVFPVTIMLSIVPYLGFLGIVWWLYLTLVASTEVQKVPPKPALLVFGIIAALTGLIYYNSVSSTIKSKEHLQEFTKELQKMPERNNTGTR